MICGQFGPQGIAGQLHPVLGRLRAANPEPYFILCAYSTRNPFKKTLTQQARMYSYLQKFVCTRMTYRATMPSLYPCQSGGDNLHVSKRTIQVSPKVVNSDCYST